MCRILHGEGMCIGFLFAGALYLSLTHSPPQLWARSEKSWPLEQRCQNHSLLLSFFHFYLQRLTTCFSTTSEIRVAWTKFASENSKPLLPPRDRIPFLPQRSPRLIAFKPRIGRSKVVSSSRMVRSSTLPMDLNPWMSQKHPNTATIREGSIKRKTASPSLVKTPLMSQSHKSTGNSG